MRTRTSLDKEVCVLLFILRIVHRYPLTLVQHMTPDTDSGGDPGS